MFDLQFLSSAWTVLFFLIHSLFVIRAILRPHREPASRVAWVVAIVVLPGLGILAYILLGETSIGRRRVARMHLVLSSFPDVEDARGFEAADVHPQVPDRYLPLFHVGHSVNGFEAVGGNQGQLLSDSDAAINALVNDIDGATDHVHLVFYIWLPDRNGTKVVEALKRAVARRVRCRALVDAVGSRNLVISEHWQAMAEAGVQVAVALPIGNPFFRPLHGRIDLRNHRKIVVIDNQITYCGSQNCADPEFLIKAKYGPWVDAMLRFEGPVARQNQYLFMSDWMSETDEDLTELLRKPLPPVQPGLTAQVIGTGPTVRFSAMPEVFETLMYAAQRELIVTTPYYVPDEAMQSALCACARRGVSTTLILPARNDSWIVAAASRSYYSDLLDAGVRIFEFSGGMLHTKSLTIDGEVTLMGSANMDRRSFELNYENNILFYDPSLTSQIRLRQQSYLDQSTEVTVDMVEDWSIGSRFINNTVAMMGPVL